MRPLTAIVTKVHPPTTPSSQAFPTRQPLAIHRASPSRFLPQYNQLTRLLSDEAPRYERDNRSASPRPREDDDGGRRRSASPGNPDT